MRGHKNAFCDLSAEFIRQVFDYEPTTGILRWKLRLSRRVQIGEIAGYSQSKKRIKVGIQGKDYMAHRIIWVWMTGKWPKYEIDHIDENQANNSWKNLRHATPSQNHRNRGKQKNNTAGYKGVTYVTARKCYIAGVKVRGKRHNLGTFKTAKEAYAACQKAAKRLHGSWSKYH